MIYFGCVKCGSPMCSPDEKAGQKETCPECSNVNVIPVPDDTAKIQRVIVVPNGCPSCGERMIRTHRITGGDIIMFSFGLLIFIGSFVAMAVNKEGNYGWMFGLLLMIMADFAGDICNPRFKCPSCKMVVDA